MPLRNWVPVDKLRAFVRHTISAIVFLVLFKTVALIVKWSIKDTSEIAQSILHGIEEVVLLGVFLYLAWELFSLLLGGKSRSGNGLSTHVFA